LDITICQDVVPCQLYFYKGGFLNPGFFGFLTEEKGDFGLLRENSKDGLLIP